MNTCFGNGSDLLVTILPQQGMGLHSGWCACHRLAERVSAHIGRHALLYDQCVSRLFAGHLDTALMLAESHCLGTRRECMCAGARMVVDLNALGIASCDTCMCLFQRPCSIGGVGYHTFSRRLKMWRRGTHGRRSERM